MQELTKAQDTIDIIAKQTDSIVLFHSLSGKDSIALLDLCYPRFKRIVVCFLYVVPNLSHLNRYIHYIKVKYPNVELIQSKHYALYNYEKFGFLGTEKTEDQRMWRLRDIAAYVCDHTGIGWSIYGFKQNDSLQRRLMLRTYPDNIEWNLRKGYPLSEYSNAEVLEYIRDHRLKEPETYGDKARSIGTDITSPIYLTWLKEHYPTDFEKVCEAFPLCREIVKE